MKIKIHPSAWTKIDRPEKKISPPDLAYLVCPYRYHKAGEAFENMTKIRNMAVKFWTQGIAIISPQLNGFFMEGSVDPEMLRIGHQQALRACDMVIIADDWYTQRWCREDVSLAKKLQIPILDTDMCSLSDADLERSIRE